MSSIPSVSNNCNRPLTGDPSGNTFTGSWENSSGALVLAVFVASPTLSLVTIQQSNNRGTDIQLTDTFNIDGAALDAMSVFRVPRGFSWFRVIFHNNEGAQTYLSLNTYLEDFYTSNNVTATISGTVNVDATNLITETLATRRVDFLVVNTWYRVASVGITTGAQWNAIGAIVDGESVPVIGRLFKCLQVGPAVAGGGTCYDVEYTTTVSLADPTSVRIRDAYGDPILTTAGNLMVGISNIYTANPLHTIVDSGVVSLDPAVALPVGANIIGFVGLDATNGYNTIAISQDGIKNGVQVVSALPAGANVIGKVGLDTGSNTIGVVGIDTSLNTIKTDPLNNGVTVNPTAVAPRRKTGLGNTAVSVGTAKFVYGASYQNTSATVNCWIKLYDSPTAPTSADTPFLIQYLEAVQLYTLSHANDNFFNAPIENTLWVRATLTSSDSDTTDTGVDCEATFFVGA